MTMITLVNVLSGQRDAQTANIAEHWENFEILELSKKFCF